MTASDERLFESAVSHIAKSKSKASTEKKLEVYANYKIATTAITPESNGQKRPGMFDLQGRAKFDAWTRYGDELQRTHKGRSASELADLARARYIAIAKEQFGFDDTIQLSEESHRAASTGDPTREKTADELLDEDDDEVQSSGPGGGMAAVSTMNSSETQGESDHNSQSLHNLAASGDFASLQVSKPTTSQLNTLDDHGFAPLHLAADKGHIDMVRLLLQLGANPDLLDSEGMTALETAEAVEHTQIIDILKAAKR